MMARKFRLELTTMVALALVSPSLVVAVAPQRNGCNLLAGPPLKGESHLTQTSLPSVYDLKRFVCAWDEPAGQYWWYSPLKKGSVNPIYGGRSGNAPAEIGQGWWLTPPTYFDVTERLWNSHSFVATRVPAFNHTSCCCQVMSGDVETKRFWLTEYCRAVVPGLTKSPYETCKPYMTTPCPTDNATALQQQWPLPPYSESYSACLDPLGTSLPIPEPLVPKHSRFNPDSALLLVAPCLMFLVAIWKGCISSGNSETAYKLLPAEKTSSASDNNRNALIGA